MEAQDEVEEFLPVEYKVVNIHTISDDLENALNEFGAEGWELVSWNRMDGYAIFKRC